MFEWAEDLLTLTTIDGAIPEKKIIEKIESAAQSLGFEHFAYGRRSPLPLSKPKVLMVNNYASEWQTHYAESGYLNIDPTVQHGRKTNVPLVWSDSVFADTPELWAEAKLADLRVGWAQSSLDGYGSGGMLTLVRSHEPITPAELAAKEVAMRWLVQISHLTLPRAFDPSLRDTPPAVSLTSRETEVLKWHGDGKTADQISEILTISVNTVKFHTKNASAKLGAANKTAAVVRAAMLGLLD